MERQRKGSRDLEAYRRGGQGPPRAVAPFKKKNFAEATNTYPFQLDGKYNRYSDYATGWAVRGLTLGGVRLIAPVQTGLHLTQPPVQRVPGLFSKNEVPKAWSWPPTASSTEVKERVELYFYTPSGPSWSILGWIF
jgi:hypothetical protein